MIAKQQATSQKDEQSEVSALSLLDKAPETHLDQNQVEPERDCEFGYFKQVFTHRSVNHLIEIKQVDFQQNLS